MRSAIFNFMNSTVGDILICVFFAILCGTITYALTGLNDIIYIK